MVLSFLSDLQNYWYSKIIIQWAWQSVFKLVCKNKTLDCCPSPRWLIRIGNHSISSGMWWSLTNSAHSIIEQSKYSLIQKWKISQHCLFHIHQGYRVCSSGVTDWLLWDWWFMGPYVLFYSPCSFLFYSVLYSWTVPIPQYLQMNAGENISLCYISPHYIKCDHFCILSSGIWNCSASDQFPFQCKSGVKQGFHSILKSQFLSFYNQENQLCFQNQVMLPVESDLQAHITDSPISLSWFYECKYPEAPSSLSYFKRNALLNLTFP